MRRDGEEATTKPVCVACRAAAPWRIWEHPLCSRCAEAWEVQVGDAKELAQRQFDAIKLHGLGEIVEAISTEYCDEMTRRTIDWVAARKLQGAGA